MMGGLDRPAVSWPEKYRPAELRAVALRADHRAFLRAMIDGQQVANLLLVGPRGVGKTSVARVLISALEVDTLPFDASRDRGIETIRKVVFNFLQTRSLLGLDRKIVFLDEADGLTSDAWQALRGMMEQFEGRFILAANDLSAIPEPIQSRCHTLRMLEVPCAERARVLAGVLEREGVEATLEEVDQFASGFRDLRLMLRHAEICVRSGSPLKAPATTEILRVGADESRSLEAPWDWEPFTAYQRFTALTGRSKTGKSTLARFYAAEKSRGGEFLGQRLTKGSVLWVATPEEHPDDVERLLRRAGATPDVHVMASASRIEEVGDYAARIDAHLVVLGSLGPVAGYVEDSNTAVDRWFGELAYPAIRTSSAAWLAILQHKKDRSGGGDDIRGPTALRAQADVTLILDYARDGSENTRELKTDSNRLGLGQDLVIRLDDDRYRVVSGTMSRDSHGGGLSLIDEAILSLLAEAEFTPKDLGTALAAQGHEVKDGALYDRLRSLVSRGLTTYSGTGKRNDRRRYRLQPTVDDPPPEAP